MRAKESEITSIPCNCVEFVAASCREGVVVPLLTPDVQQTHPKGGVRSSTLLNHFLHDADRCKKGIGLLRFAAPRSHVRGKRRYFYLFLIKRHAGWLRYYDVCYFTCC